MKDLLLKSLDSLSSEDLEEVFASAFSIEGDRIKTDEDLLNFILDHAIKVELDRTKIKKGVEVVVTLTPRATRHLFMDLRILYYQGLEIEQEPRHAKFQRIRPVTRRGPVLRDALMKALLQMAYEDAFYGQ